MEGDALQTVIHFDRVAVKMEKNLAGLENAFWKETGV